MPVKSIPALILKRPVQMTFDFSYQVTFDFSFQPDPELAVSNAEPDPSAPTVRQAAALRVPEVEAFCQRYQPWLIKEARRARENFRMPECAIHDLIQEGEIAIALAYRSYDDSKGSPFNYFKSPVRWRMNRFARKTSRVVETPEYCFHRVPYQCLSLDAPVAEDQPHTPVMEVQDFSDPTRGTVADLQDRSRHEAVRAAMELLSASDRTLLEQLFMEDQTLQMVGNRRGVSGSRVGAQKLAALRRMRFIIRTRFDELLPN